MSCWWLYNEPELNSSGHINTQYFWFGFSSLNFLEYNFCLSKGKIVLCLVWKLSWTFSALERATHQASQRNSQMCPKGMWLCLPHRVPGVGPSLHWSQGPLELCDLHPPLPSGHNTREGTKRGSNRAGKAVGRKGHPFSRLKFPSPGMKMTP